MYITVADRVDKGDGGTNKDTPAKDASLKHLLVGQLTNVALPSPTGELMLFFEDAKLSNHSVAVTWAG
jgi:hypothetical protein